MLSISKKTRALNNLSMNHYEFQQSLPLKSYGRAEKVSQCDSFIDIALDARFDKDGKIIGLN